MELKIRDFITALEATHRDHITNSPDIKMVESLRA
jgi:hypothetical protein